MNCKRLKRVWLVIAIITLVIAVTGCDCSNQNKAPVLNGFSVTFLSVGQGDSAYITFPDGKNMLIDCGVLDDENYKNIKMAIDASTKAEIDYLVLTHTGSDHVGNVLPLLEDYKIKQAFIPDIDREDVYPFFHQRVSKVKEMAEMISISSTNQFIKGEDYFIAFLSPYPKGVAGSFYNYVNAKESPSEQEVNNASAIIYIEYNGFRFLFLGDAEKQAQTMVYENYNAGLFNCIYEKSKVDLEGIDFLKVAHHGAKDGVDDKLHKVLSAKNCVISVGKNNFYGHPSTEAIDKLIEHNNQTKIFRTDVLGNITVKYESGCLTTKTWAVRI